MPRTNRLAMAETLMNEGGVMPLDMAVGFMAEGCDMNRIEDQHGREAAFEINDHFLDYLSE